VLAHVRAFANSHLLSTVDVGGLLAVNVATVDEPEEDGSLVDEQWLTTISAFVDMEVVTIMVCYHDLAMPVSW